MRIDNKLTSNNYLIHSICGSVLNASFNDKLTEKIDALESVNKIQEVQRQFRVSKVERVKAMELELSRSQDDSPGHSRSSDEANVARAPSYTMSYLQMKLQLGEKGDTYESIMTEERLKAAAMALYDKATLNEQEEEKKAYDILR